MLSQVENEDEYSVISEMANYLHSDQIFKLVKFSYQDTIKRVKKKAIDQ